MCCFQGARRKPDTFSETPILSGLTVGTDCRAIFGKRPYSLFRTCEAKARVSGPNAFLSLDEISIAAGRKDGLYVKCEGRLGRIPLSVQERVSDVSIVSSVAASEPAGGDERVLKALFKTTSKPSVMRILEKSAPGIHEDGSPA